MAEVLTITYLILLSSVKFLFVPFLSINFYNYSFFTAVIINTAGGIIGSTFFFKTSFYFVQRTLKKRQAKIDAGKAKPKKIFTKMNRFIVVIKNTMGMYGLALITPALISIPIGSVIAAKYYHLQPKKMLGLIYLSSALWAMALSGFAIIFK
jgi:hypothetical protein